MTRIRSSCCLVLSLMDLREKAFSRLDLGFRVVEGFEFSPDLVVLPLMG